MRRVARNAFRRLNSGDYEAVLRMFAADSVFAFPGEHALAGVLRGDDARRWFERAHRVFPGHQIEPQDIVVSGPPWNTIVATHFLIRAPLPSGRTYVNEGMQFLRLRWGRVLEDRLFEDSQALSRALDQVASAGITEAHAPPLGHDPLDDVVTSTGTYSASRSNL